MVRIAVKWHSKDWRKTLPVYEYECSHCRFRFELRQRFETEPVSICPRCQEKARRVLHSVPVIFKGSGFYVTDYGRGTGWRGEETTSEKGGEEAQTTAGEKSSDEGTAATGDQSVG